MRNRMPKDASPGPKIDGSDVRLSDRFDDDEARRYWRSRSAAKRLAQVEILRRINHGHRATDRILGVIEVVEVVGERDLVDQWDLP